MKATIRIEVTFDAEGDEEELSLLCRTYISKAENDFVSVNPDVHGIVIYPQEKRLKANKYGKKI